MTTFTPSAFSRRLLTTDRLPTGPTRWTSTAGCRRLADGLCLSPAGRLDAQRPGLDPFGWVLRAAPSRTSGAFPAASRAWRMTLPAAPCTARRCASTTPASTPGTSSGAIRSSSTIRARSAGRAARHRPGGHRCRRQLGALDLHRPQAALVPLAGRALGTTAARSGGRRSSFRRRAGPTQLSQTI